MKTRTITKIKTEKVEYRGPVRPIDNLGRIVIPMEYRKELDLHSHDKMEILMTTNNEIILRKVN